MVEIYKHKTAGYLLRLHIKRESEINTYIVVDKNNNPILKNNPYSFGYSEQRKIIKGFDNLEKFPCTKCM